MFFLLKVFDQSAWDKRLSFLGKLGLILPTTFENFVLDTRYTVNLVYLTVVVFLTGLLVYLFFVWLFKIEEMIIFSKLFSRIRKIRFFIPQPKSPKEKEAVTVEEEP